MPLINARAISRSAFGRQAALLSASHWRTALLADEQATTRSCAATFAVESAILPQCMEVAAEVHLYSTKPGIRASLKLQRSAISPLFRGRGLPQTQQGDVMQWLYEGFEQTRSVREYSFQTLGFSRHELRATVVIDLTLMRKHGIHLQDGPTFCLRKLGLATESVSPTDPALGLRIVLSDQEKNVGATGYTPPHAKPTHRKQFTSLSLPEPTCS
jgi:hypothetical protein